MDHKYDADEVAKNRQDWWKNVHTKFYKTNTSMAKYRRQYIADLGNVNNISSVFEVGCNSGANLLYISNVCQGVSLVGIDICQNAIDYGKKVEKNPADLRLGSI